ncbi:hypothetical protein HZ326_0853 [Fusarium oxysporum f. sp. albedinis]|nr:hypothetical protein HZ326_0853 [Fusarium oxysporum f. sp. albedinis]
MPLRGTKLLGPGREECIDGISLLRLLHIVPYFTARMGRMQCSICPDLQNEAAWPDLHFFACRASQSVYTS